MSEARTETTEARPQQASAPAAGSGKHRGPAASEDAAASSAGRHRRPTNQRNA
ncbi:hypothetical protein [Streptomyces niger]|uniref:hypothetical protein n=1 Tax=Streptomyces niger TaxID=66373 RepID=UPI000B1E829D|nr:hypothetical protein [Streptomyces niger]